MGNGKEKTFGAGAPIIRRRTREITEWHQVEEAMMKPLGYDDLSVDQKQVFMKVVEWYDHPDRILTLGGYAGTGKSTLVAVLAREFERLDANVAFCAYTGKAANVLKQKLRKAEISVGPQGFGRHFAGTIHSLIYKPLTDVSGEVVDWELKGSLEGDYSLIVIDEASMIDEKMLEDLMTFNIPILAVGDHGQLPPVQGIGTLMRDPELRLEEIHRQAADNPIIALSKYIRENKCLPEEWPDSPYVKFGSFDGCIDALMPVYAQQGPSDVAILTFTNRMRQHLNHQARCMRENRNVSTDPKKGDIFMCLRNTKGTIFNGMRGILESEPVPFKDHWWEGTFFFPDDDIEVRGQFLAAQIGREKTFKDFGEVSRVTGVDFWKWGPVGMLFDYGYAMTVHKSQGSQFPHVALVHERPGFVDQDEYARWLYTGVTRSSEYLYIVTK